MNVILFVLFRVVYSIELFSENTFHSTFLSAKYTEMSTDKCQELNQNCNKKNDDCCASKLIRCEAFPPRKGSSITPTRCDNCLDKECKFDNDCCGGKFLCEGGKCTHPIGEPCDSNFNTDEVGNLEQCYNHFLGCFEGKCMPCGFRTCKSDSECCVGKKYTCDSYYGRCVKTKGCFGLQYACVTNEDCCPFMGCIEGFCKSCVKELKACKGDSECCPGMKCQKKCVYAGDQPLPPYKERKCVGKGGSCKLGRKCCSGDCIDNICAVCSASMDPCGTGFDPCCSGLSCFKNPKALSTTVCAEKRLCMDLGDSECNDTPCCEGECIDNKCLICTHQNEFCKSSDDCCPNLSCFKDPKSGFKTKCSSEPYCTELKEKCTAAKPCCHGLCVDGICLDCKSKLEGCKADGDCCPGNKCYRDLDDSMKTKCNPNPFCAELKEECNEVVRCCEGKCHNGKCTRCKSATHTCTAEHPCCDPLICTTNPKKLDEEICAKSKLCDKLGDSCESRGISCCQGLCFNSKCTECTKEKALCQPGVIVDCCESLVCVRNPDSPASNICATGKLCEDQSKKCSKEMPCCDALCFKNKCVKCIPQNENCLDVPCCDSLICTTNPANIKSKICAVEKLCGEESDGCSPHFKCCDQDFQVCHNDVCTKCLGMLKVCGDGNPPCCGKLLCVTDPSNPQQKVCSDKVLCHDLSTSCLDSSLKCCEGLCFKEKCVHCTVNFSKCSPLDPPCCDKNICTTDPMNPAEKVCSDKKLCSEIEEECTTLACCIGVCFKNKCVECLPESLICSKDDPPCCGDLICTTNIKAPEHKVCSGEPMCNDLGETCGHNALPCCLGMCFKGKCVECGKSEGVCSRDDPPCCDGLICTWNPKTGTSSICFEHETCIEPGGSCLSASCCNQFKCWRDVCRDCWGPGETCHLVENSKGCCLGLHCVLNPAGTKTVCLEDPESRVALDGFCMADNAHCETGLHCFQGQCKACFVIGMVCKEQSEVCPGLFCTWTPEGSHKEVRASRECIKASGECEKHDDQTCCSSLVCWENKCQLCGISKHRCEDGYPPCCSSLLCSWDEQGVHQVCGETMKRVKEGGLCDDETKKCAEGTRCFLGKCQTCAFPEEKCENGGKDCCEPLRCKLAENGEHLACTAESSTCVFENGICAGPKAKCCERLFCDENRVCRKKKLPNQACESNHECEPGYFCTTNTLGSGRICLDHEGCIGVDGKCKSNYEVCEGLRCWDGFAKDCVGCEDCEKEKPPCDIEEEEEVNGDVLPQDFIPDADNGDVFKNLREKPFETFSKGLEMPEGRILKEPDSSYIPPKYPGPKDGTQPLTPQPKMKLFPEPYELTNMTIPYEEEEEEKETPEETNKLEEGKDEAPKDELPSLSPQIEKPVDIADIPVHQEENKKTPPLESPLAKAPEKLETKKTPKFEEPLETPRTSKNNIPEILKNLGKDSDGNPLIPSKDGKGPFKNKDPNSQGKGSNSKDPNSNSKGGADVNEDGTPKKAKPVIIDEKEVDPSQLRPVTDKEVDDALRKEINTMPSPYYKTPDQEIEKWGLNYPLSNMKHYQIFGEPWTWKKKWEAVKKQKQSPFNHLGPGDIGKDVEKIGALKRRFAAVKAVNQESDIFALLAAATQRTLKATSQLHSNFYPPSRLRNIHNSRLPQLSPHHLDYRFRLKDEVIGSKKRKCCHGLVCTVDERGITTHCSKKKKCVEEFGGCTLKGAVCCKGLNCDKGTCLKCQRNNTDCSTQPCCGELICTFSRDGRKRVCRPMAVAIEEGGICKDPEASCEQSLKCWNGICLNCLLKGDQCPSTVPCCNGLMCTIEKTGDRKSCATAPGCVEAQGFCSDKDSKCCENHFCNALKVCEPKRPEDTACDDNEDSCMDHLTCTISTDGKGKICAPGIQCVDDRGSCALGAFYCCSGTICNEKKICVKPYLERDEECRFDTRNHTDEMSSPVFFSNDGNLPKTPCQPSLTCELAETGRRKVCQDKSMCIVETGLCEHPNAFCCDGLRCGEDKICHDCGSESQLCEESNDCCEGLLCGPDAMGESRICQVSTSCVSKGGNCGDAHVSCCSGMECLETDENVALVQSNLRKTLVLLAKSTSNSNSNSKFNKQLRIKEITRKLKSSSLSLRFKESQKKNRRCNDCLPRSTKCDINGMYKCCGEMVCKASRENEFETLCGPKDECGSLAAPCDFLDGKCCDSLKCFRQSMSCRAILREFEECVEGEEELCEEGTQCRVASDGETRLCLSKATCVDVNNPCNLKGAQCCKDSFCFEGQYCKPIKHCIENGKLCEVEGPGLSCCDPSVCALDRLGKFNRCMEKEVCIVKNGFCGDSRAHCCPGNFCGKDKKCNCLKDGRKCESESECCMGLSCYWNEMGNGKVCSPEKKCVLRGGECSNKGTECCLGTLCLKSESNPNKKICQKSPYCIDEVWKGCHETLRPCCDNLFCGLEIFETNNVCHPVPKAGDQCTTQEYCSFNKDEKLECIFNVCVPKKRKCSVLTEKCNYDADCCKGFACSHWGDLKRCKKMAGYKCEYSDDCVGRCDPVAGACCDREGDIDEMVRRKLGID